MKVHLTSSGCLYEGGSTDGVFATRDAARASILKIIQTDKDRRVKRWEQMTAEEKKSFIDNVGYPLDRDEPWTEEETDFWTKGADFMSIDEFDVQGD
jgi:hypothetical protein